jgi:hypothetical protein
MRWCGCWRIAYQPQASRRTLGADGPHRHRITSADSCHADKGRPEFPIHRTNPLAELESLKMKFATAARIVTFVGMALSLHAGNASAANPGKSAMDCVSAARDKNDVVFTNNCGSKVFVVWCGEMKYSKQRCGDGPKGNSFYTHSNNIEAGKSIRANGIQEYRYAACHGGIAFGKDEIQDRPDGSFTCIASGAAARKPTAESTRTPATATASRPAPTATAQDSPLGTWLVTTDAGQKLKLTFSANGATYDDGEDQYPGRWSQQGRHISVQIFATEQHMRRNETPVRMELDLDGKGMTGAQLPHNAAAVNVRQLRLTLTRLN